jgi:hypothetical protein
MGNYKYRASFSGNYDILDKYEKFNSLKGYISTSKK